MKTLFPTLKNYNTKYLGNDILAGIIIAAVSIPISMGYAQIAGLPAVYGLYGSVFPILIFALFSTSPQFIFGVDAAPAALIGASLLTFEIENGSIEALSVVPAITICTALWLLLFSFIRAGKLVNYISTPVMGGFITGICCEIILMQIPKLMGGTAGTGELPELIQHIFQTISVINIPSLLLGTTTLAILIISKKRIPKIPMAVIIMVISAVFSYFVPLDRYGVILLPQVSSGLPKLIVPSFKYISVTEALGAGLPIAIVIMAETLLAENSYAIKNGYKLDDNNEIFAFGMGNLIAALTGCCPINGSVSRTAMSEQYGGKTQLTGIVAGITMIAVLLFATGFIQYLPVPVLTAIVISALMGACEFHLAKKLLKVSRNEFYIFLAVFMGVLLLGTIYGVLIGVTLSFVSVVLRAADPPRCYLGISPGHEGFYNMSKFKYTYPVKNVVIYRFSSNLFFANANVFQNDIENAIKEDTKVVIVDCAGIGSIDVTAAERIEILYNNLNEKNIKFYLTEHIAALNDQMRSLGIGHLIENGAVRRYIETALKDAGIPEPYPLEGADYTERSLAVKRAETAVQEFVWAYGSNADKEIEKQIDKRLELLKQTGDLSMLSHGTWHEMDIMDEDEWFEHLEAHLTEICKATGESEHQIAHKLELRRRQIHETIKNDNPELANKFEKRRSKLDEHLKTTHPDIWEKVMHLREEIDAEMQEK